MCVGVRSFGTLTAERPTRAAASALIVEREPIWLQKATEAFAYYGYGSHATALGFAPSAQPLCFGACGSNPAVTNPGDPLDAGTGDDQDAAGRLEGRRRRRADGRQWQRWLIIRRSDRDADRESGEHDRHGRPRQRPCRGRGDGVSRRRSGSKSPGASTAAISPASVPASAPKPRSFPRATRLAKSP